MLTVTLFPDRSESDNRVEIDKVVRAYAAESKTNPKACIYLMGYGTQAIQLPVTPTVDEGGRMRSDLMHARELVMRAGAPVSKIVIIGVLSPNGPKAGQIDVVCTPVALPVVVWTENGAQTGAGHAAPDDDDYAVESKYDSEEGKIDTEVSISFEKFGLPTKLLQGKLSFQGSSSGLDEVSGNLELVKKKLAEAMLKGHLQKVTITITGEWKYETDKNKVTSKIKAALSADIPMPGLPKYKLPVELFLFVDREGKVTPGVGITIFQFN